MTREASGQAPGAVTCLPVTGLGEVHPGTDLAAAVRAGVDLRDGDVVVVTSKVVSKAEGRLVTSSKAEAVAAETDRVVAVRGGTRIVRTRHGLVMAGAGVDASNVARGTLVLLPEDPDRSARALRTALRAAPEPVGAAGGPNVAVVVTDTSGRAWRNGQTDLAIGAAGLAVLHDYAGRTDPYGNPLVVTAPAVADEIAAAADLVKGKLAQVPVAVLRGLAHLVLAPGEDGPGARALVRDEAQDMFGLGAREAVTLAASGGTADPEGARGFGAPTDAAGLCAALHDLAPGWAPQPSAGAVDVHLPAPTGLDAARTQGVLVGRALTVAFAYGWTGTLDGAEVPDSSDTAVRLRFTRRTP